MNQRETTDLQAHDVSAMTAVCASAFSDESWKENRLQSCFGVNYRVFGVKVAEHLCGFVILYLGVDDADLICIAVEPAQQGTGLGQLLLEHAYELLRDFGLQQLFLEVRVSNTKAIRFYEKQGFKQVNIRKRYYRCDDGSREDAVVMSFMLNS